MYPTTAERVYRLLMRAYPAEFRRRYENEMSLLFRDQRRESTEGALRFWLQLSWDVARSAPALRAESMRSHSGRVFQLEERKMKPMAILAILIGAVELLGAIVEVRAGWPSYGGGLPIVSVLIMMLAALLLLGAGIGLLLRAPAALRWANGSAITCLAAVVLVRLTFPWMSIFSTMLAVGFPIALLLFLRVTNKYDQTGRRMA
jgi:hypothetical protein